MDGLQAPADAASDNDYSQNLLPRSSSWLVSTLDNAYGEDSSDFGISMGTDTEGRADTPDGMALAILHVVLRIIACLHSCHALMAREAGRAAPGAAAGAPSPAAETGTSTIPSAQGPEWEALPGLLCKCLSIPRAAPARKPVRRLLRRLFATRLEYEAVRDRAAIAAAFGVIESVMRGGGGGRRGIDAATNHLHTVEGALAIRKLVKLASARVWNWQVHTHTTHTRTRARARAHTHTHTASHSRLRVSAIGRYSYLIGV